MRRRTFLTTPGGGDTHEYVEIAGIKWAKTNIGAEKETDYGLYFQWGDTQGYTTNQVGANSVAYKKPFYYADYKFNNGINTWNAYKSTKYNSSVDKKTVLDLSDDAARLYWGGNWRLPTVEEFRALGAATTVQKVTNYKGSGINGNLVTDKTDPSKTLFLPIAGLCNNGSVSSAAYGYYWSSSVYPGNDTYSYCIRLRDSYIEWNVGYNYLRTWGFTLRPILDGAVIETRPLLVDKPYVEIAGTKWATMNIGANSETDYGLYFQWGDTTGYTSSQVGSNSTNYKKPFNMTDCVLHNGTSDYNDTNYTKYNSNDGLTELEPMNDAAVANWGGNWRMPTKEEFVALGNATTAQWVTNYNNSGKNGMLVTDKTDSSKTLFFPAAGYCGGSVVANTGSSCSYWSSSLNGSNTAQAYSLLFNSSSSYWSTETYRYSGKSMRPVLD